MDKKFTKKALDYHKMGRPGKIEITPTKDLNSEKALALAYSPGVAAPCLEIAEDPHKAYDYTAKGNLVAVVTNGTAVLGLGNIGALAGKPVMEGKGVLFKQFADIDVFDIELKTKNNEDFITAVKAMEPTFGGINLEDIKGPDCFEIEKRLSQEMNIPVFHDDQHGTAIICAAAFVNACFLTKKKYKNIKVVFNGAGAAAIACAKLLISLGVQPKNLKMCDSKGVIHSEREDLNKYKKEFAIKTKDRTLADALDGADAFMGLSVAHAVDSDMVKSMAKKPIIFAMANPDPEILPDVAHATRKDVIMATGRSDFPNQVNNVLGFPAIFRGALDVRATRVNEEMKLAAVYALAELAREDVPESVSAAYGNKQFKFGTEYIIPKPFDPRVLIKVAPAVAQAAMDSCVALKPIENFKQYQEKLEALQGFRRGFIRTVINRVKAQARKSKKEVPTIVFPEGRSLKILKALNTIVDEGVANPILLGYKETVKENIKELELDSLSNIPIHQPSNHPKFEQYVHEFYKLRQRKGITLAEAERLMADPFYFSSMMVHMGDADALVSGAEHNYVDCVKPILKIIGSGNRNMASGLNIVIVKNRILFFSDTTVNKNPTADQLSTIAYHCSRVAEHFNIKPRVGLLSYSNFSGANGSPAKMKEAAKLIRSKYPHIEVDGEMQADTAVNKDVMSDIFPFCKIQGGANILIFPNLESGNISYKLVQQLGGGEVLGPFLMGVKKPANVLQRTCSVEDIINTIVMTALEAQAYTKAMR